MKQNKNNAIEIFTDARFDGKLPAIIFFKNRSSLPTKSRLCPQMWARGRDSEQYSNPQSYIDE